MYIIRTIVSLLDLHIRYVFVFWLLSVRVDKTGLWSDNLCFSSMIFKIFVIILICLSNCCHGLVIISPSSFTVSHTIAKFGGDYKNETLFGIVKEVEPWDACTPIHNNITDYIALAIRGGSPLCSFSTKVKNVRMFVL